MIESRLRILNPVPLECCQIYTVTIVIHKSRNLIGTLGISEFGPKYGQVFESTVMSRCLPSKKEHRETRDSVSQMSSVGVKNTKPIAINKHWAHK